MKIGTQCMSCKARRTMEEWGPEKVRELTLHGKFVCHACACRDAYWLLEKWCSQCETSHIFPTYEEPKACSCCGCTEPFLEKKRVIVFDPMKPLTSTTVNGLTTDTYRDKEHFSTWLEAHRGGVPAHAYKQEIYKPFRFTDDKSRR